MCGTVPACYANYATQLIAELQASFVELGGTGMGLGGAAKAADAYTDRILLLTFEKGARMRPGVASKAELPHVTDGQAWLRGTEANAGRIPGQIAEKLQGREFKDFNEFRSAFWKEVADDPVLSAQFDPNSLIRMRNGFSPEAPPNQQVGGRKYYELDHTKPISEGGGIYDMNNLIIRTPLNHIRRHQ